MMESRSVADAKGGDVAYGAENAKVPGECSFGPGRVAPEGGQRHDRRAEPKTHVNGSTDLS